MTVIVSLTLPTTTFLMGDAVAGVGNLLNAVCQLTIFVNILMTLRSKHLWRMSCAEFQKIAFMLSKQRSANREDTQLDRFDKLIWNLFSRIVEIIWRMI